MGRRVVRAEDVVKSEAKPGSFEFEDGARDSVRLSEIDVDATRIKPWPKQVAFLLCPYKDVLWAGSRGGAKSTGLLMLHLQYAQRFPKTSTALYRRTTTDLGDLIRESEKFYAGLVEAGEAQFNKQEKVWRFSNGSHFYMRYLEERKHAERYQGHNVQLQSFDEAQNWESPELIDLLWGTLRSPQGYPTYRRLTGNPGGPGHWWLVERYKLGKKHDSPPMTPFTYRPLPDERPDLTIEAMFMPSYLEDNPALANSKDYEAALAAAGGKDLYKMWRYGDWDINVGGYFDCFDYDEMTGMAPDIPYYAPKWCGMDFGSRHATAAVWFAQVADCIWAYREMAIPGRTAEGVANDFVGFNNGENIGSVYLSPDAKAFRGAIRSAYEEIGKVFVVNGLPYPTIADNDRQGGAMLMYQLLKNGTLKIDRSLEKLIQGIKMANRDPDQPLDILKNSKTDWEDVLEAARYGLKTHPKIYLVPREVLTAEAVQKIEDPHERAMTARILNSRSRVDSNIAYIGRRGGARLNSPPLTGGGRFTWADMADPSFDPSRRWVASG